MDEALSLVIRKIDTWRFVMFEKFEVNYIPCIKSQQNHQFFISFMPLCLITQSQINIVCFIPIQLVLFCLLLVGLMCSYKSIISLRQIIEFTNQSSLKNIAYSYMKLTNNLWKQNFEEVVDFSQSSMFNVRQQMINNSLSYNNETLLLETTEIFPNCKHNFNRNSIADQQINGEMISYYQSSLGDLCSELEITLSNDESKLHQEFRKSKHNDLYGICKSLIDTIKKLETRFKKIQEKENRKQNKCHHRYSQFDESQQKEVQSTLTYSFLKNSKDCQCNKNQISNISNFAQSKSIVMYKQQNQDLNKHVIKLKETIQGMKKMIKKMQGENIKLKELLKQYQNFNRKKATERKILKDQPQMKTMMNGGILNPAKSQFFSKTDGDLKTYISRSVSSHIIKWQNQDNEHIKDCSQYVISSRQSNSFNDKQKIKPLSLISLELQSINEKQQKSNSNSSNFNINVQKCRNKPTSPNKQQMDLRPLNKMERYGSEYIKQSQISQNKGFTKAFQQIQPIQQRKYDHQNSNGLINKPNHPKTFKQIKDTKKIAKQNNGISKIDLSVLELKQTRNK